MATTAAPGYFEEVKLGDYVHQVNWLYDNHVTTMWQSHDYQVILPPSRMEVS